MRQKFHCRLRNFNLIMKDCIMLVFVKVWLRSNHQFGDAGARITLQKQRKLIATANHYLQTNNDINFGFMLF
ncbi:MAG TPA: YraN family protein [Methylophilaceae bacterium]|nr:YraN family protein [Methylophilaceae bacterium]